VIVTRWGDRLLPEPQGRRVELSLKTLEGPAGTCLPRSGTDERFWSTTPGGTISQPPTPIQWGAQSAKRRSTPDVITSNEVRRLLTSAEAARANDGVVEWGNGIEASEKLFASKWKDVDFQK